MKEPRQDPVSSRAIHVALQHYFSIYRKYWSRAIIAAVFPAIGSFLIIYAPAILVGQIINNFSESGRVSLSDSSLMIVLFGAAMMIGELCWRIGMHFNIKMVAAGLQDLNAVAFKLLQDQDYAFYANNFIGSVTKKSLAFARNLELFTDTIGMSILPNFVPLIIVSVILWNHSPLLPIVLIGFLIVGVIVGVPIIRMRTKTVIARHNAHSRLIGFVSDNLTNMVAVKSFANEDHETAKFTEYSTDAMNKSKISWNYQNLRFDLIISPIYVLANVAGLLASIYVVQEQGLRPGDILVIFTFFAQMTRMFWEITRVYRNLENSITEAAEFIELVIEPPQIVDSSHAKNIEIKSGSISFKNVSFTYPENNGNGEPKFFDNFNLYIPSGQKIGLVGPSGGGKTTLSRLLLRFIDIDSGEIKVGGHKLSNITLKSLRQAISYVPQEPMMFHRTIADNIRYGKPDASMEEVEEAARKAHAKEFIDKLPQGYETLIGERGVKLSGGQRQRIALARAIIKDSPILILDEATSALDSESERLIQIALKDLMKNRTAIVIAHRLSTIQQLDRILVLKDGQIEEDGTHKELQAAKGLYAELWSHQSGGFLED